MQFTTTSSAAVAAIVLGLVAAQSSNIPSCAQDCISQYTSGGNPIGNCTGLDVACICRNSTFINQVSCCVGDSCDDSSDRDNAINYARGICSAAGVSISDDDARCNNNNATTTGGGAGATTSTVTTTGTTSDATSTGTFTSTRTTTGTGGAASPTDTDAPNVGSRPGAYALGVGAIGGAVAAGMMILV